MRPTRLSPRARLALRVGGALSLLVALALIVSGVRLFLGLLSGSGGGQPLAFFVRFLLAVPFFVAGGAMLQFGFLRPMAELVATESEGATEVAAAAAARGLARGGFAVGGAALVKVRCRACGYLETEDATFCSRCAKPL